MLQMDNVSKTYRHRGELVTALDSVSVGIEQGEFVSIVGPSGCGKSTLLLMLGGMLSPTSGRVLMNGTSIYDLDADRRAALRTRSAGFVFQSFHLVGYLTALENVQIPMYLAATWTKRSRSDGRRNCSSAWDWATGCITNRVN